MGMPAAPADGFDLWLRRSLQTRHAAILAEPLPPALLGLLAEASTDGFDQRVRERAYFLWLEEGRPEGRALEHWMAAFVQQVGQEASGPGPASATTGGGVSRPSPPPKRARSGRG